MPQIVLFLDEKARNMIVPDTFEDLGIVLIEAVEAAFGIKGHNDVAFDVIAPLFTKNESHVQIEVRYTAGKDEYGTGSVFDPNEATRTLAITQIRTAFMEFLHVHGIDLISPSVWIRPHYNSTFSPGVAD